MSRRREAADLARALALSTQEARTAANLSPHTLSSKSTTQDSREMELRAVLDPKLFESTADQARGSGSHHADPISSIQPFTDTQGYLSTRRSHLQSTSDNSMAPPHQPPRSSPIYAIPSSRLSTTEKSHSSGSSSHRPLFSPTQTSNIRNSSKSHVSETPPVPQLQGRRMAHDRPIVLSPSPPPALGHSSDHEVEEEEEPVEDRSPRAVQRLTARRSNVEIVIPQPRKAVQPFPMSPSHDRDGSPDPLDANLNGETPRKVLIEESIQVIDPPNGGARSSVAAESQISAAESASTRRSSRVVDLNAKREKELEEKRAKRRAEKEAKKKKDEAAARRKEKRQLMSRGGDEGDGKAESSRKRNRDDDHDTRRSTRTAPQPISDRQSVSVERETRSAPTRKLAGTSNGRHDEVEPQVDDDLESWDGSQREIRASPSKHVKGREKEPSPPVEAEKESLPPPKKSKKTTKAKKAAKRKRVVEDDADDEDAGGEGLEQDGRETIQGPAPKVKAVPDESDEVEAASGTDRDAEKVEDATNDKDEDEQEPDPAESNGEKLAQDHTPQPEPSDRPPLTSRPSNARLLSAEASSRASPGPSSTGIKWKTTRNDLNTVLSKFPGARQTGMSKRHKIVPLHMKIGPPVKALPPPPPKPTKKKKEEDEDDDDDDEASMESEGEGGLRKKSKVRGIEWFMQED